MGALPARLARPAWAAIGLTVVLSGPAGAAPEPVTEITFGRVFDSSSGLRVAYCTNIRQDATGFLWIGSPGGVFRYDGQSFHLVLPEDGVPIGGSTAEPMVLRAETGSLFSTKGDTATPLPGPDGRPLTGVRAAIVGSDGALWAVRVGGLLRRAPDGTWTALEPAIAGETRILFPDAGPTVLAATDDGLFRLSADGGSSRLARAAAPMSARAMPDGSVLFGCADGSVHRFASGRDTVLLQVARRLIGVEHRGETDWVTYDAGLVALDPGKPPVWVIATSDVNTGGSPFADREGSLWIATPHGLLQLPEPDTRLVPNTGGGRSLAATGETLWHALWGGTHRAPRGVVSGAGEWRAVDGASIFPVCVDDRGRVWQATENRFQVWDSDGRRRDVPVPGLGGGWRCSTGADGALWLPTNVGVLRLPPPDDAPRIVVRSIPGGDAYPNSGYRAFESASGDLFVARGNRICRTTVREALGGGDPSWSCQTLDGAETWAGFATLPSGETWAAAGHRGFVRYRAGRWEPIPGSASLPSQWTTSIRRNRDGTVWLTGSGFALRVAERPDSADGWEVVEQLATSQGVPAFNIADALEDRDGSVWLSNDVGIQHVPAPVRTAVPEPPRVALAEASIDGRAVPEDVPLRLPFQRNRLELRFAAASFRDPSRIRYRSRLGADEAWSPPTSNPHFRFVDVAPGTYRVEVEATVDGTRWSPAPAVFEFSVGRPWYREPRSYLAALLAAVGVAFAAYRARVGVLLRLERQRARIAMDLHDELGSGLGTIGILAGVAARPGLDAERRDALVERIGAVARQLGGSLTDMVWTLKRGASNLASLAAHLRERGEAMFPGPTPVLEVNMPDPVPPLPVSLAVRRNVALIGLEALHNAARHAGARKVGLSLSPSKRHWVLEITDDGKGIESARAASPGHGTGLESMRRRCERIGGELAVRPAPGGGTVVRLRFSPGAEGRDEPSAGHDHATGRPGRHAG